MGSNTITVKEDLKALKAHYKQLKHARLRMRVQSLIMLKAGTFKNQRAIAYRLGIDFATLKRWYKIYREQGLATLLQRGYKGNRPSVISPQMHQGLAQKTHAATEPFQSYTQAVEWVKDIYGQAVNYSTLRNYLIRHFKTKVKRPRKSHYKKDEQAVAVFKKTSLLC